MPVTLIQRTSTFATVGVSLALSYVSNVTSGDLLIAIAGGGFHAGGVLSSVTDSQGNSWSIVASQPSLDTNLSVSIAWAVAKSTGANTVTANFSGAGGSMDLIIAEYGGGQNWAFDRKNSQFAGVPPDTTTTGSITTTASNEVLIVASALLLDQTPGWNVSAGFTIEAQVNNTSPDSMAFADQIVSSTGTYSATIGGSGVLASNEIVAAIASFSFSSSGPGSCPVVYDNTANPVSGINTFNQLGNVCALAASFTAPVTQPQWTLASLKVKLQSPGAAANQQIVVDIYSDNGGPGVGSLMAHLFNEIINFPTTASVLLTIPFPLLTFSVPLVGGSRYWIVIHNPGGAGNSAAWNRAVIAGGDIGTATGYNAGGDVGTGTFVSNPGDFCTYSVPNTVVSPFIMQVEVCPLLSSPAASIGGGGGGQIARGGCRPFNHYDACLLLEISKLRKIHPLPPCSVPPDLWNMLPWESDFGSLPALAVPFRKIQSITTPAPAAGDTPVVLDIVPQGYDGILTGFYWRYNGQNFIEGSGDIIWRIQINMRFVKDLSNVSFTIGSPQTPMPMVEGGQLLQSRQRVGVVVNVPNLSGTIQVGASTITAGLFGFFWPKGVPGWTSR